MILPKEFKLILEDPVGTPGTNKYYLRKGEMGDKESNAKNFTILIQTLVDGAGRMVVE
ncbi:unnamed protein product, partial [Allacma fusca]